MSDLNQKLDNFRKALRQLEDYLTEPIRNNRDKSGIIQAFEFTFEAFIKICQAKAQSRGAVAQFPRDALEAAVGLGIIDDSDEEPALAMLSDRNSTSHLYIESLAEAVFQRVITSHVILLRKANLRL